MSVYKGNINLSYNERLAKIEEQAEEIKRLEKLVKKAFEEGWEHEDKDLTTIENGWYESDAQKSLKEK